MIKLKDILKEAPTYPSNQKLRMFRTGIKQEPLTSERIETDIKEITGENNSASKRSNGEWRIKFYVRRELPNDKWNKAVKHVETVYGGKIDKQWTLNDYERNWEPEEPPEWVPSIYFKI